MQPAFLRRHLGAACLMLAAGLASAAHADTGNVQRAIDWAQGQASVRHPASDDARRWSSPTGAPAVTYRNTPWAPTPWR